MVPHLRGINYLRNSVKIVIDAYDGDMDFYVADSSDIVIRTYQKIFPGVFKPLGAMPAYLRNHIRYPVDYLTVQADMYSVYHMNNPEVFYQREDVWQFATERYREDFQRVKPYYVMVQFPETDRIEMVLMIPFTPKNKNVMNAWMAGRCDPPHYGEVVVIPFPKGVEVLGPRQVEARIDQDSEMSQKLTLWGQRGSAVIRGNLLAIPLFTEKELYIIYVEPVYIQAENAQLPEVKRIALADQQRVVWDESFEGALRKLFGEAAQRPSTEALPAEDAPATAPQGGEALIQQALEQFNRYQRHAAEGNFGQAGQALDQLKTTLQELEQESSQQAP